MPGEEIEAGVCTRQDMRRLLDLLDRADRFVEKGDMPTVHLAAEYEKLLIFNADSVTMPPYGCGQVVGTVVDGGITKLKVTRPTTDKGKDEDGNSYRYVFNRSGAIEVGRTGEAVDGPHFRGIGSMAAGKRYAPTVNGWNVAEKPCGIFIGAGPDNVAPGISRGFIDWAPPDIIEVNSLEELLRCGVRIKKVDVPSLLCEGEGSPGETNDIINPEWCHKDPDPPYPDDTCYNCYLNYETASSPTVATWCQIGTSGGTAVWSGCDTVAGIPPSDLDREGFPPEPRCYGSTDCEGDYLCTTVCDDSSDCDGDGTCVYVTLSNASASEPPDVSPPLAEEGSSGGYSVLFYHSETIDDASEGAACHIHYFDLKYCGPDVATYISELATWNAAQGAWEGVEGQHISCAPDDIQTQRDASEQCAGAETTFILLDLPQPGCCDGDEDPGPGPGGQPPTGCCGSCTYAVDQITGQDLTIIFDIAIRDFVNGNEYTGGISEMLTTKLADGRWVSQCRWIVRNVTRTILGGTEVATLYFTSQGGIFRVSAEHADGSTLDLGPFAEPGPAAADCNGLYVGPGSSNFTINGGGFCGNL